MDGLAPREPHSMTADEPLVIALEGDWDVYRVDELRQRLESVYDAPDVILDLSGANYIDSTCLGALVHLRKERDSRGLDLAKIVIASPMIQRIFHIVRLDEAWPTFLTLDDAAAACRVSR